MHPACQPVEFGEHLCLGGFADHLAVAVEPAVASGPVLQELHGGHLLPVSSRSNESETAHPVEVD
jgi:hypothetical protein